jgi:hypothetical protein
MIHYGMHNVAATGKKNSKTLENSFYFTSAVGDCDLFLLFHPCLQTPQASKGAFTQAIKERIMLKPQARKT